MQKFFYIFLFIIVLAPSTILYAEQYRCVAKNTAGFSFNNISKKWKNTYFESSSKYLISQRNKSSTYQIKRIGDNFPDFECYERFNKNGVLSCEDYFSVFIFNKSNGRYLRTYTYGYWNVSTDSNQKVEEEQKNTPFIEIGVCTLSE